MRHSILAILAVAAAFPAFAAGPHWIEAWQASPTIRVGFETPYMKLPAPVHGTIRYTMRLTARGGALRVRLSGETRDVPFAISRAGVAIIAPNGKPRPGSARALMFGGDAAAIVPAGAPLLSDPVALPVVSGDDVVVTFDLPTAVELDQADQRFTATVTDEHGSRAIAGARPLVSAVDVEAGATTHAVVALGDSITDGTGGTDPMRGWPGALAERLKDKVPISIVNAGIAGNRLLGPSIGPSALARFDRDVGAAPGVTAVILLEGINDIGAAGMSYPGQAPFPPVDAEAVIGAYRQLIARAHLRGLRIVGATLTPFAGVTFGGYYSPAKDAIREEVNRWIRRSGAFDGVIDFDAVVRDSARPDHIAAKYDSGDHLHPSDAGYRAMAAAIDLRLLE